MPGPTGDAARRIEKLRREHTVEGFDCGREQLNRYLVRYAWQNQQAGAAQTYVGLVGDAIIGFYTLAVGQVTHEEAPERLTKGLTKHPVPIMLLARLAVDRRWHGQGAGSALFGMPCAAPSRRPILPVFGHLQCMRRTKMPDAFMSTLISSPHPPIPCIFSFCSRMCAGLLRGMREADP